MIKLKYFKCGLVLKPFGIKGELKVKSMSDFDRFSKDNTIYIFYNNDYVMEKISSSRFTDGYYYIKLYGKEDINLVEKYHSKEIFVSELEREKLDEGEFYYSDLIGKKVINQNKEERGIVIEVRELPRSHYLVVKYNDKNYLIPFIDEFVKEIDDEYININEIEGLF